MGEVVSSNQRYVVTVSPPPVNRVQAQITGHAVTARLVSPQVVVNPCSDDEGTTQTTLERLAIAPGDGQTVFTLPSVPSLPHLSAVYLNGVRSRYGVDYVIDGLVLTWQGVRLSSVTDFLEILY